jgi:dTDP-4-dehydrorhamnose 3,5-epimerase/reductase
MGDVSVETTPIPGLLVVRLALHTDDRGWFVENWQRAKMTPLGLPDFGPVQANVAVSTTRGTLRGMHAEPWDKLVALASGSAYAAWVDLRPGPAYGRTHAAALEPGTAVFIPRGVANGYQTLVDGTSYSYLVNEHWRADASYLGIDPLDPALGIAWPLPIEPSLMSERDRTAPRLAEAAPYPARRPLILGAGGQLGRALATVLPEATAVSRDELDVTDASAMEAWPWSEHDVVLNAAAYTAVDLAETPEGRAAAWAVNAEAVSRLARLAAGHRFTLVHYSTDYVFDGERELHDEDEPLTPLGVYGQTKAAGEVAVATAPRHYLLRSSWVVGDGANFVRTMARLADAGTKPDVVSDQVGRLTFADELARATCHLLTSQAAFGTYHVTNGGPAMSWAEVAREVFAARGRDPHDVREISTEEYAAGRSMAPRPRSSVLSLSRLEATGFEPIDGRTALRDYCESRLP